MYWFFIRDIKYLFKYIVLVIFKILKIISWIVFKYIGLVIYEIWKMNFWLLYKIIKKSVFLFEFVLVGS